MSGSQDSYNRGGFIAFIFSMVFSIGFFLYLIYVHPGVELNEAKAVAQKNMEMSKKQGQGSEEPSFDVSKVDKPWVYSDEMAGYGNKVYATNCAACHGAKADANSPVAKTMSPPPRNFIKGGWIQGGKSLELFKTIADGVKGSTSMVAFKGIPVKDRWALVHFIRSITKDKPEDDLAELENFAKSAE